MAIGDATVNILRTVKPSKILLVEILPIAGQEIAVGGTGVAFAPNPVGVAFAPKPSGSKLF